MYCAKELIDVVLLLMYKQGYIHIILDGPVNLRSVWPKELSANPLPPES